MKILIVTQKMDIRDPVLGFFHRWVREFAAIYEQVTVICLEKGLVDLPQNVSILSLGREEGRSDLDYLSRFYRYVIRERNSYDVVFVHMNQEYVLLGGLLWRFMGKRVFLWRNHQVGNILTTIAGLLSNKVFYTSPQSYTARFKNSVSMPVGIDTDFYKPDPNTKRKKNSILFLGRLDPIKNVELFIRALHELKLLGISFSATIAGESSAEHRLYEQKCRALATKEELTEVVFVGPVTQKEAQALYQTHEIYVNLTPAGSMDKTMFEAMASGMTPIVLNQALKKGIGSEMVISDPTPQSIAEKLSSLLRESPVDKRNFVVEHHSLKKLLQTFNEEIQ